MEKYRFRIYGDNAENLNVPYQDELPILFECTFYTNDNETEEGLNEITDTIYKVYNNPQRIGAPMSKGRVDRVE